MLRCEISSGATAFCSPRSWKDTLGLPENSCFPECRFEFWLVLLLLLLLLLFFKVFIEFVTILLLLYVLFFWLQGMWDLGSLSRDRTCTPCVGRQCLNHWTTREIPWLVLEEKEDDKWSDHWKTRENKRHYLGDRVRSVVLSFSFSLFSLAASVSPPLLPLLLRSQTLL